MLRKTGTTSGSATASGVGIEAEMRAGIATMSGSGSGSGSGIGYVTESVIGNVCATATAIGTCCEALRPSQPRLGRRDATKSRPSRPRSK